MPVWHTKFKLKDLLNDDALSNEQVAQLALTAHQRMTKGRAAIEQALKPHLRATKLAGALSDWNDVADEFHSVAVVADDDDKERWFNDVLAQLYDWAGPQPRLDRLAVSRVHQRLKRIDHIIARGRLNEAVVGAITALTPGDVLP